MASEGFGEISWLYSTSGSRYSKLWEAETLDLVAVGMLMLTGTEKLGKVRAKASSLALEGPGSAWLRDCRTGVEARRRGEPGVGRRTGRGLG